MSELIETIEDGVATLTMNRPEAMNALSGAIMGGLLDALPRLAADMRFIARSARMTTAFAKVGFSGDFGSHYFLHKLVGTAKARELYFTADIIDAEQAGALGIVNRVVADDELQAETTALARRIADGPRIALGYMKRNLLAAETEPFQTVLELEAEHQARCAFTEDHKEAVAAFVEKRRPVFQGR